MRLASCRKASLTTIKLEFCAPRQPLTAQPCSAVLLMSHYLSLDYQLHWGRGCCVCGISSTLHHARHRVDARDCL